MAMPPTVFAGRYEIVREIARGGMADVFLARDETLDRPVAVKVLFAALSQDPNFVERFRREAQAAASLNHPNIVAVYDWGQEQGTSFIVMEYVDGRTLRDLIRAEAPLDPAMIADIGGDTAAALSYAHQQGVVHRDVKPGNVLITPTGQVKVADFGIARADNTSDALTRTGAVMGTATYFAPEQAQGLAIDARSDVYSLGVVLYEMATGVPPFTGENPVSVAYQHVREDVVPPSQRVATVPAGLERVIMAALAKQPEARYQTADDLRADLLRFRRGQPVLGGPDEPLTAAVVTTGAATTTMAATRATDTALPAKQKRNRGPIIAMIAVLLVLAAGIGILLFRQLGDNGSGAKVTVPRVVGTSEAEAVAILKAANLDVDIQRLPNDRVPKGIVVRQDPEPETRVTEGDTVKLVVSAGAGAVEVPDVTGLSFVDAQAELEQADLKVERRDDRSETVEPGRVIGTDPEPGTEVEPNSTVIVVVSQGPAPANVPDVTGVDQVQATQTLVNAGFVVQRVIQPSDSIAAGAVINTSPGAGSQAPRGSTVKMFVSSGTEQVTVPNVVGQSEEAATSTLEGLGFNVTTVEVASSSANNGKVISQAPSAGVAIDTGSNVTITVGTGPPPPTTTTT